MKPIPEVRIGATGQLENWIEFERWAIYNDPRVHLALRTAGRRQVSYQDALKLALFLQTVQATELAARLTDLHARGKILPEDIRFDLIPKTTPPKS